MPKFIISASLGNKKDPSCYSLIRIAYKLIKEHVIKSGFTLKIKVVLYMIKDNVKEPSAYQEIKEYYFVEFHISNIFFH